VNGHSQKILFKKGGKVLFSIQFLLMLKKEGGKDLRVLLLLFEKIFLMLAATIFLSYLKKKSGSSLVFEDIRAVLGEGREGYPLSVLPAPTTGTRFPRHLKQSCSRCAVHHHSRVRHKATAAASWKGAQKDVPIR